MNEMTSRCPPTRVVHCHHAAVLDQLESKAKAGTVKTSLNNRAATIWTIIGHLETPGARKPVVLP